MHVLAVTFDGSGNLTPFIGFTEALVAAGHRVTALAHRTQQAAFIDAGADVCSYRHAAEHDSTSSEHRITWEVFAAFNQRAVDDVRDAVEQIVPDVLLIDCMMTDALSEARSHGRPVIALVHSAWHIFRSELDGIFRAPAEGADVLVVASYRAFHEGAAPPHMVWVGPLRATPPASTWRRRLRDRPFVVTSLSSGQQNQHETLRNVCAALAESPVDALVTVGRAFDPAEIVAAPNVRVERMIPHEHVLDEADLLITHGGHGTAMIGLRFGVPLLCLPNVGDQPAIAERVVALGLGRMLDKSSTPETIGTAVALLLADTATRTRAQAFAREVADHPGPEAAIATIEALYNRFTS
jgi:UDP:flavonoid glycosyltransferase YjiC (YdhE family)